MRQLSGLDTFFLNLETNAVPMHVGVLCVLDPATANEPLSFAAARAQIESRLHLLPAFRRRLLMAPLNLDMPYWIEDPDFDIENHVRYRYLAPPGGHEQLVNLVCEALATRLDREKPLWEMIYIEGLADGHVAIFAKIHHACIDGVSGADLMSQMLDLSPNGPGRALAPAEPWEPAPMPTPLQLYQATAHGLVARPRESWRLIKQSIPLLLSAGRSAWAQRQASRRRGEDGGSGLSLAPRTRFNRPIDARRGYAHSSIPLQRFKDVKNAFRVSLNDVVLAVSAQALRGYLEERGELPGRPLIAGVPVSVRHRGNWRASGNQIKFVRISLATNLEDPIRRLRHIHASMSRVKHEDKATPANLLGDWAEVPAPALMMEVARLYENFCVTDYFSPPFNLIISNVPGPRSPLYFAGARVLANYPASIPYHGLGFNITVFSYQGSLDIGLTAHRGAVPDLDHFLQLWIDALALYEVSATQAVLPVRKAG